MINLFSSLWASPSDSSTKSLPESSTTSSHSPTSRSERNISPSSETFPYRQSSWNSNLPYQTPRQRAWTQFGYFAAGASLFTCSILLTRRAIRVRNPRHSARDLFTRSDTLSTTRPDAHNISTRNASEITASVKRPATTTATPASSSATAETNGAVDAALALVLATLNVSTLAGMLLAGTAWANDISDLHDLRIWLRRASVRAAGPVSAEQKSGFETPVEERKDDIEEWISFFGTAMQGKVDGRVVEAIEKVKGLESAAKDEG